MRSGHNPLDDAGLLGLVAPPEQLEVIGRIQSMMSLLEGHGDVTMDRAGAGEVPDAPWFARVLRERRRKARMPARLLQQLMGIDAKLRQYEQGERFIGAVESSGRPGPVEPGVGRPGDAPHHGRDPPPRDLGGPDQPRPARHRLMPASAGEPVGPLHIPGRRLTELVCAVSGGPDSLALLVLAVDGRARGDRRARRPRAARRLWRRSRRGGRRRRPLRRRRFGPSASRS